jgi:hypothetical protein
MNDNSREDFLPEGGEEVFGFGQIANDFFDRTPGCSGW